MKDQYNHKYDDIINLPHPTSKKHPRMSLYARAAQFSPFAALTGHEAAIKETVRQTDAKQVLSEEVIAELNKRLYLIAETIGTQQMVEITYFVPDTKKDGGAYITCSGCVKKIDKYKGECKMSVWLCQIAKNLWYDQCRKNKKFVYKVTFKYMNETYTYQISAKTGCILTNKTS